MKSKAFLNWSSGKDSALSYYKAINNGSFDIKMLFTNVNKDNSRISMHGVHTDLLKAQAKSINIPLVTLELPSDLNMETYNSLMLSTIEKFKKQGVDTAIFGDIFLEDLKNYRVEKLAKVGVSTYFPLWKTNPLELILEFIDLGFKSIITCVNTKYLDKSFLGRIIDHKLISELPSNTNICGENGEYHTFTFDGPIFLEPIDFTIGKAVYKEYLDPNKKSNSNSTNYGFWFCDLHYKNNSI